MSTKLHLGAALLGAALSLTPAAALAATEEPAFDLGGPDLDAYIEFRVGVMDEEIDLARGFELGPLTLVLEVSGLAATSDLDFEVLMEGADRLVQITSGLVLLLGERHALFAAVSVPLAPPGAESDEVVRVSLAYTVAFDG
jgi:hypothetical protein